MKIPVYCKYDDNINSDTSFSYFKFNTYRFNNPIVISLNKEDDLHCNYKSIIVYIPYGTFEKSSIYGYKELEALCWNNIKQNEEVFGDLFYNSTKLKLNQSSIYYNILDETKIYYLEKDKDNKFYISDREISIGKFKLYKNDIIEEINLYDESNINIFLDKFKTYPGIPYFVKIINPDKYPYLFKNHIYSIISETDEYYNITEVFL